MEQQHNRILKEIEANIIETDAEFAELLASGPRLTTRYKLAASAGVALAITLILMFSTNILFGLFGYVALVGVATHVLSKRPLKPAEQSPLEIVHRLTAGLFRDTGATVEPSLDQ